MNLYGRWGIIAVVVCFCVGGLLYQRKDASAPRRDLFLMYPECLQYYEWFEREVSDPHSISRVQKHMRAAERTRLWPKHAPRALDVWRWESASAPGRITIDGWYESQLIDCLTLATTNEMNHIDDWHMLRDGDSHFLSAYRRHRRLESRRHSCQNDKSHCVLHAAGYRVCTFD